MPLRLRSYSWSQDILIELLHGQILITVGPEYQEFSSIWESLDNNKRKTNSLFEKLCTIKKRLQTLMAAADSSAFAVHASTTRSRSVVVKTTLCKPGGLKKSTKYNRQNRTLFQCDKFAHLKKKCRKLKADNNREGMGSSSVDGTTGSTFSAVTVNSVRRSDKWVCDSGASHHMTPYKQYFAKYKRFSVPVSISLVFKGTILACGSDRANIEILVEGK